MSINKISRVAFVDDSQGLKTIIYPKTTAENVIDMEDAVGEKVGPLNTADYAGVTGAYTPVVASLYDREMLFSSNHTVIIIPGQTRYMLGNKFFYTTNHMVLNVGDFVDAATRAGKDLYIYAVDDDPDDEEATTPKFVISMNSTYPDGYTADTSRKIGGFHCLCLTANIMQDYDGNYETFYTGDVLPYSHWDLRHRPATANPEGMVFIPGIGMWVDIYLNSVSGSKLVSQYGGTIADGTSSVKFHWYKYCQWIGNAGKRLPTLNEFMELSLGTTPGYRISTSADPVTTGGHTSTNGERICSMYGIEDAIGVCWQPGVEPGGPYDSASWINAYDANDSADMRGQSYNAPNRILYGGAYNTDGTYAGSGTYIFNNTPLTLSGAYGARGVCAGLTEHNINEELNALKNWVDEIPIEYIAGSDSMAPSTSEPSDTSAVWIENDTKNLTPSATVVVSDTQPSDSTAIWLETEG